MKRLFQSRVGLSPLRHHNFKDIPCDTCLGEMSIETTEHFLIYCDLYSGVRFVMFQVINPILDVNLPNARSIVNILLSGHGTLSVEPNTAVLIATVNCIHKSTRFDHCLRTITKLPVTPLRYRWPFPISQFPSMLCAFSFLRVPMREIRPCWFEYFWCVLKFYPQYSIFYCYLTFCLLL